MRRWERGRNRLSKWVWLNEEKKKQELFNGFTEVEHIFHVACWRGYTYFEIMHLVGVFILAKKSLLDEKLDFCLGESRESGFLLHDSIFFLFSLAYSLSESFFYTHNSTYSSRINGLRLWSGELERNNDSVGRSADG
jgi:hypothetical protein